MWLCWRCNCFTMETGKRVITLIQNLHKHRCQVKLIVCQFVYFYELLDVFCCSCSTRRYKTITTTWSAPVENPMSRQPSVLSSPKSRNSKSIVQKCYVQSQDIVSPLIRHDKYKIQRWFVQIPKIANKNTESPNNWSEVRKLYIQIWIWKFKKRKYRSTLQSLSLSLFSIPCV